MNKKKASKSKSILTVEENAIFKLLPSVANDADEFDDPENGDYLDRLESIFRTADQLDSFVVKIAIDRTHFFMGNWSESYFSSRGYEVIPATSPATDRLNEALTSTIVSEDSGLKRDILQSVDELQVEYFWRECLYPDPSMLEQLRKLITKNKIQEPDLLDFVRSNILHPWNEFLDEDEPEDDDDDVQLWFEECEKF